MSVHSKIKRITVPELRARKGAEPIVSLTAYHAHTARYVDPYVDFLLVGDSLEAWEAAPTTPIDPTTNRPFTSRR